MHALQAHLNMIHGITGDEYKKRYKVTFLFCDRTRLRLSRTKTGDRPTEIFVPHSRAEIMAELKAMAARRPFQSTVDLRRRAPRLYNMITNHIGPVAQVFNKLGLRTPRPNSWSREKVLAVLRKWNSARHPPSNALRVAAVKKFGSWKKAVKAAGIRYDIVRTTRKQAESRARKWSARYGALNYAKLNQTSPKLRRLLHNKFGGIEKAAKALGIPFRPTYTEWSPQRVIDIVKKRVRQGKRVRAMVMWREECTPYKWGIRFFKSWNGVLRACGLDPREHSYARELELRAKASGRR